MLTVTGAGCFLSRVLSGIAVVSFPSAKQEGTLYLFADKAHKRVVKSALYGQGILCVLFKLCFFFVVIFLAFFSFRYQKLWFF